MLVGYCAVCDRRMLVGIDEVEWVHNLAPGLISVTSTCPRGHQLVVLTGESFTPRVDPRVFDTRPCWLRTSRRWWTRLLALWPRLSPH
ncbi:hypothetical protein [Amycolatopsis suaedae]|uniref:Uncharacterized protein n=1 Tax=Amycolatopsis suaedae TaxID=2510978 RepID=A0A4V2EMH7_9PSEU|nr:hypothetical protein [Amycolatopsis suaedae]RZQ65105.1 hypothetical protein EWH70_04190 [Amycolatopsis suaedae]